MPSLARRTIHYENYWWSPREKISFKARHDVQSDLEKLSSRNVDRPFKGAQRGSGTKKKNGSFEVRYGVPTWPRKIHHFAGLTPFHGGQKGNLTKININSFNTVEELSNGANSRGLRTKVLGTPESFRVVWIIIISTLPAGLLPTFTFQVTSEHRRGMASRIRLLQLRVSASGKHREPVHLHSSLLRF